MNELMKINFDSERPTVSGRELHKALGIMTSYKDWFPRMREYGFAEGSDFNPLKIEQVQFEGNRQVVRELIDHQLTIPMAKEIAMLQRTETGKRVRQYFIAVEESWNRPEMVLARAVKIQEQMLSAANKKVFLLEAENAAMKPKADFYDAVADSKGAISIGDVAKIIGIPGVGQKNLFRFLRDHEILMSDNTPYQYYIDRGYFRVIEQAYYRGSDKLISKKTLVYQKGVDFIRLKLNAVREQELYGV